MNPSNGRIIFRADPEPQERNGVILVSPLKENITGEVIAVGADVEDIKVGDRVLSNRGHTRHIEGDLYCAMVNPDRLLVYG